MLQSALVNGRDIKTLQHPSTHLHHPPHCNNTRLTSYPFRFLLKIQYQNCSHQYKIPNTTYSGHYKNRYIHPPEQHKWDTHRKSQALKHNLHRGKRGRSERDEMASVKQRQWRRRRSDVRYVDKRAREQRVWPPSPRHSLHPPYSFLLSSDLTHTHIQRGTHTH